VDKARERLHSDSQQSRKELQDEGIRYSNGDFGSLSERICDAGARG
jgi:hypothetical protein